MNIFLVARGMFWGTSRDKIMLVGAHYDSKPPSKGKSYLLKVFSALFFFQNNVDLF